MKMFSKENSSFTVWMVAAMLAMVFGKWPMAAQAPRIKNRHPFGCLGNLLLFRPPQIKGKAATKDGCKYDYADPMIIGC